MSSMVRWFKKQMKKTLIPLLSISGMLLRMGVPLVAGTDLFLPGRREDKPTLFGELRYFVEVVGMTPAEALAAATINNASVIGIEENRGSIHEGKVADLAVLRRSPLENIDNLSEVLHVIQKGRIIR